jgi:hypothetical protein
VRLKTTSKHISFDVTDRWFPDTGINHFCMGQMLHS